MGHTAHINLKYETDVYVIFNLFFFTLLASIQKMKNKSFSGCNKDFI